MVRNPRAIRRTPGLMWTPTTKVGLAHGIKKLKRRAEICRQTARLLADPKIQRELANGRIPPELKSPTFREFFNPALTPRFLLDSSMSDGVRAAAKARKHKGLTPEQLQTASHSFLDLAEKYNEKAKQLRTALAKKKLHSE